MALIVLVPAQGAARPGPRRVTTGADGTELILTFTPEDQSPILTVDSVDHSVSAHMVLKPAGTESVDGLQAQVWQTQVPADPGITAATTTLADLADLTGGRLPVGLAPTRTPGPFQVSWSASETYNVVTQGDSLISAQSGSNRVATLRGGGISSSKTVSLGTLGHDWATPPGDDAAVAAALRDNATDRTERTLWRLWLPLLLGAAAVASAVLAIRAGRISPTHEERQDHHHEPAHQIGVAPPLTT